LILLLVVSATSPLCVNNISIILPNFLDSKEKRIDERFGKPKTKNQKTTKEPKKQNKQKQKINT